MAKIIIYENKQDKYGAAAVNKSYWFKRSSQSSLAEVYLQFSHLYTFSLTKDTCSNYMQAKVIRRLCLNGKQQFSIDIIDLLRTCHNKLREFSTCLICTYIFTEVLISIKLRMQYTKGI